MNIWADANAYADVDADADTDAEADSYNYADALNTRAGREAKHLLFLLWIHGPVLSPLLLSTLG